MRHCYIEDDGIEVEFKVGRTEYDVFVTDTELNSTITLEDVKELLRNKLARKIYGDNIRPKVEPLLGQTIEV